jgi:hypothetical protein
MDPLNMHQIINVTNEHIFATHYTSIDMTISSAYV